MHTVLLVGEKQSGKSSAADFIKESFHNVIIYNFADELKNTVHRLYNIPLKKMYGTDAEKNEFTHIKWVDTNFHNENKFHNEFMTIREVLQHFADVCKMLDPMCFTKCVMRKINIDKPNIAVIADGRFRFEFDAIQSLNPINIRCVLPNSLSHNSEKDLQNIPLDLFDLVLEKSKLEIYEKNVNILRLLNSKGVS